MILSSLHSKYFYALVETTQRFFIFLIRWGLRRRSKNLFLHRGTRGDNNYQTFSAKRPVTNIAIIGTLPATFSGAGGGSRHGPPSDDPGDPRMTAGGSPGFQGGVGKLTKSLRLDSAGRRPLPLVKINVSGTPPRQMGTPPGMSENPKIWSNSRNPEKMTKTAQIRGVKKHPFFDKVFPGGSKTPPKRKPLPANKPDFRSFFGVELPRWEVPKSAEI